jgi:hypothetical protein
MITLHFNSIVKVIKYGGQLLFLVYLTTPYQLIVHITSTDIILKCEFGRMSSKGIVAYFKKLFFCYVYDLHGG